MKERSFFWRKDMDYRNIVLDEWMEKREYSNESISREMGLPYRLYLPKDCQDCRLILFFHGAGRRGNDNYAQIADGNGAEIFMKQILASSYKDECLILAPQCPLEMQWVGHSRDIWSRGEFNFDEEVETLPMQLTLALLEEIIEKYRVDRSRIYVSGLSMGGFATYYVITKHPELFAAAVAVCGGGDPAKAGLIKHIPLYAFHGLEDDVVPPSSTRKMVAALRKVGAVDVRLCEFPHADHNSWQEAYQTSELYDWLFTQRKRCTK